jgi:hypothetical protein
MVSHATFNNISAILCRFPVIVCIYIYINRQLFIQFLISWFNTIHEIGTFCLYISITNESTLDK